ncbi:MerR family transcriptional regulator [Rhodospirillum rubrum]|uniref:MerR family transcriptional regulator n=1 Tax=Rhodospirillum rubrum TaxID=1085 RepID=UPI00190306D6|nr:helix-turn-helix domain-containing protein [Rhodospirillum rubrum]MBK1665365.1 MerR family transcriptional regulator [Rhodospirillum rubrum]MBK1678015.1 MerR family transcriptional regulator [Rhodospirillum rubrum]
MTSLAIGALSAQTGVKSPTIRYYEEIGLLPSPPRTDGNRRIYSVETVRRLKFIRHARELGFEVEAIRQLLALADDPQGSCAPADGIALAHLRDIDSRIDRLTALRDEVRRMVSECAHGPIGACKVIEVLADHTECLHDHH